MKKILLILAIFVVTPQITFAQGSAMPPQYLPHLVAGQLPASEWSSKIFLFNNSSDAHTVFVEIFDDLGRPMTVATDKGINDKFSIPLLPGTVGTETIEILRNNGFVSGWAKVTSLSPVSTFVKFQQFALGDTKSIGQASVFSSLVQSVLTFPLDSENGVALVNPGSQDATVNFFAFNKADQKVKEGSFSLVRGGHMAVFFREAPFFLESIGKIVISSNIPLSGIALDFDGMVFSTLPSLPAPRRLDSKIPITKIGFIYINSSDRLPMKKEDVQARVAEAVSAQQFLLDKELPINGFSRVQLPYDFDDNGLPKVVMVQGGPRDKYFDPSKSDPVQRFLWDVVEADFINLIPKDWTYRVIFTDFWRVVNGQFENHQDTGYGSYYPFPRGSVWLSAVDLPFLKKSLYGNKNPLYNYIVPELGNIPTPHKWANTVEDQADAVFGLFNHEAGHSFWLLGHSDTEDKSKFRSMVGRNTREGCFNIEKSVECIMLPIEAHQTAYGWFFLHSDLGWILRDFSPPEVEVLSKELSGGKLKITFRTRDSESGINSFFVETRYQAPYTRFWRTINHSDDLENIVLEVDISGNSKTTGLIIFNNQWVSKYIPLF